MSSPGPSSPGWAGSKSTEPTKSQFFRPMQKGRMTFSQGWLSMLSLGGQEAVEFLLPAQGVDRRDGIGKHQHGGLPGRKRPITWQSVPLSTPRDRQITTPHASRETPLSSPPGAGGGVGTSRSSNREESFARRWHQRRSIPMLPPAASQYSSFVHPQRSHSVSRPRHKANVDSLCRK